MTLICVKVGRAITCMKYLAKVISLIFILKTLTWNKIMFLASGLLKLPKLVVNYLMRCISKTNLPIFLFLSDLPLLNAIFSRAYNWGNRLHKKPYQHILLIIIRYQSSNFGFKGIWNENLWKGLKLGISFRI